MQHFFTRHVRTPQAMESSETGDRASVFDLTGPTPVPIRGQCVSHPRDAHLDAWLNLDPKRLDARYAILDDRERPYTSTGWPPEWTTIAVRPNRQPVSFASL
ncbi:hypothetical protein PSAB6_340186 [Paraburkholderia sabiae]|nr:hypothetical protein PSAB6_340186 [Paraburkholderia sabiae]